MEKRRSGITFRMDRTFKYHGLEIPQAELYELACQVNVAEITKQGLAMEWFRRKHESAKRAATTQHIITQKSEDK